MGVMCGGCRVGRNCGGRESRVGDIERRSGKGGVSALVTAGAGHVRSRAVRTGVAQRVEGRDREAVYRARREVSCFVGSRFGRQSDGILSGDSEEPAVSEEIKKDAAISSVLF